MDSESERSEGSIDKPPQGPVKKLRIASNGPILPFLTMPYIHAQRILHLARKASIFHVFSVYIARKALRLVTSLNDVMDKDNGPSTRQRDERITLLRELTELENEIRMWGMEADDPAEYQHRIPRIKQQYIKFTRNRFYLTSNDTARDDIFDKLLAYEQSNMAMVQRLRSFGHGGDSMDVDDPMSG